MIIYNKILNIGAKTGQTFIRIQNTLLKMRQNKKIILFLYSFKRGKFFLEGGAIALNAPPQLQHCIDPSEVVCRASDVMVISWVVISQHTKVKNFNRNSAGPKQDFCYTLPP